MVTRVHSILHYNILHYIFRQWHTLKKDNCKSEKRYSFGQCMFLFNRFLHLSGYVPGWQGVSGHPGCRRAQVQLGTWSKSKRTWWHDSTRRHVNTPTATECNSPLPLRGSGVAYTPVRVIMTIANENILCKNYNNWLWQCLFPPCR